MSVFSYAPWPKIWALICVTASALLLQGCESDGGFDPDDPARGPGGLVGQGPEVSPMALFQGVDAPPPRRK